MQGIIVVVAANGTASIYYVYGRQNMCKCMYVLTSVHTHSHPFVKRSTVECRARQLNVAVGPPPPICLQSGCTKFVRQT